MADDSVKPSLPTPLGLYDKPRDPGGARTGLIAAALSALWLAMVAVFFLVVPQAPQPGGTDGLRVLITVVAIVMPLAMIWVATMTARSARVMREETQRLHAAVDGMRQAYIAQKHDRSSAMERSVEKKLDEIAAAARKTETALATFTSARHEPAEAAPEELAPAQPALAFEEPLAAPGPVLAPQDFIAALNFPETAEDEEGFAALRRALKDRNASQLVQAAQDVLTLLSQDGVYMDDLRPDRARPEVWRSFAEGQRGRAIAALGGVRDRSPLALAAGRMKQDPIFRDAAHHFLRKFDQIVSQFVQDATDAQLAQLADTRTTRAFMLLGRVAGTFD